MKAMLTFDFELNDFASPLRIINPESQKMGNPEIKPVIAIAFPLLFSPVLERIKFAMLKVAPVLSSVTPIIVPKIIRKPIEAIVDPNPSLMALTTSPAGRVVKARKTDTRKRDIKAFNSSVEVRIIIAMILIATRMPEVPMLIYANKSLYKLCLRCYLVK